MEDEPVKQTDETEKPEPTPKETVTMPETDFHQAAKNAGYALVPEADLAGLNKDREELKSIRSLFPEDARGKEGNFLKGLTEKATKASSLEQEIAQFSSLKEENESLKNQNQDLTRKGKLSDMWGHISRIQQMRNVRVHDKFIDEAKLVDFPLDKHDFSKPEGIKKFTETVWKDVLEPAYREQVAVVEQVSGPQKRQESKDKDDGESREHGPFEPDGRPTAFGSWA